MNMANDVWTSAVGMGPLNGAVLLVWLVAAVWLGRKHMRSIAAGDPVRPVAVALLFAFPLAYSIWANVAVFGWEWSHALSHEPAVARQTLLAIAMGHANQTQIWAGSLASLASGIMLVACLRLSTSGERPQLAVGGVAAVVTVALTASALIGGAATSYWGPAAIRSLAYLTAGLVTTGTLLVAHRRGPGSQMALIAGLLLPVFVAAVDLAATGVIAQNALEAIALASPESKQAMMDHLLTVADRTRALGGVSVLLSATLAVLAPVAVWRRERSTSLRFLGGVSASFAISLASMLLVSGYLAPFKPVNLFLTTLSMGAL